MGRIPTLMAGAIAAALLTGAARADEIVVGGKDFTEQLLLAVALGQSVDLDGRRRVPVGVGGADGGTVAATVRPG